jgi:Transposase.
MYDLTGKFQTKPRMGHPVDFKIKRAAVDAVVKKSLSCVLVCAEYDISRSSLKDWLDKFRQGGYENLRDKKPGGSFPRMPKKRISERKRAS